MEPKSHLIKWTLVRAIKIRRFDTQAEAEAERVAMVQPADWKRDDLARGGRWAQGAAGTMSSFEWVGWARRALRLGVCLESPIGDRETHAFRRMGLRAFQV